MSGLFRPQWAALAAVTASAALGAGWWSAGPGADSATVQAVRINPPEVDKPGWQALAAARYLAAHPGQPVAKATVAEAKAAAIKAAAPPPPDIAVVFRQDLTAVVGANGSPALMMASLGPKKLLRRGAVYRDNWRLAELDGEQAVLRRGSDQRRISLFGPAATAQSAAVQFVVLPTAQQLAQQRQAQANGAAPATPAAAAANAAQPTPAPVAQNQGGQNQGGQNQGGGGGGRGGRGFGGGRFGGGRGQGFGGQPPAPAGPPPPPLPPVVIVPGGAPAPAAATAQ